MAPKEDAAAAASRKRAADEAAEGESPAKEGKVEAKLADAEPDAEPDTRPRLEVPVTVEPHDTTVNVVPTLGGRLLMPITDAGMGYLLACARGNAGVKAGRYLFETRIMEVLSMANVAPKGQQQVPKLQVRVGFSVMGSSIFLGETSKDSVCFDSDGCFTVDMKKKPGFKRFARENIIGVLLNLEEEGTNAKTVSLYVDGERCGKPQPLPEGMLGKALCPHVGFRGVSLQVNFGTDPMAKMPFKCRMIDGAAKDDVEVFKVPGSTEGKFDVVFPVALPDEGGFEWLDNWLEKHPHFVELSDRKIVDWVQKSGIWKPKTQGTPVWKTSNDRPEVSFGIPVLDSLNARKVIQAVAPLIPRHYVVMEVKGNLLKEERMALTSAFNSPHFRRIARVTVGEPNDDFKKNVYGDLLKAKQIRVTAEWKARRANRERKKMIEQRQKQLAEVKKQKEEAKKQKEEAARKRIEEAKQKAAEAAEKKAEQERKKAEAKAKAEAEKKEAEAKAAEEASMEVDQTGEAAEKGGKDEDKAEEESKETKEDANMEAEDEKKLEENKEEKTEEKTDEKKAEEETEAKGEKAEENEETKTEEKTEEKEEEKKQEETAEDEKKEPEKADEVKKEEDKDDEKKEEAKDEEREDVKMEEDDDDENEPIVTELTDEEKKQWFRIQSIPDIATVPLSIAFPSFSIPDEAEGFEEIAYEWRAEAQAKEYLKNWVSTKKKNTRMEGLQPSEWFFAKLQEWQKVLQEWQLKQKEYKQEHSKKKAAPKPKAKPKETPEGTEEGGETKEEGADDAEDEKMVVEEDVFTVTDVLDIGDGEPLFANFMFEDWALVTLRFELYLLVHSFKKDCNDPERPGIPEAHMGFYYNKYFRKQLNVKFYGMATQVELVELVKDTVGFQDDEQVLINKLGGEYLEQFDMFVRLTEDARRERTRRIEAGDDSAKLRFSVLAAASSNSQAQAQPKRVMPPGQRPSGNNYNSGGSNWQNNNNWQGGGGNWNNKGGWHGNKGRGKGGYGNKSWGSW